MFGSNNRKQYVSARFGNGTCRTWLYALWYEATSPLVFIRFLADEPVYRTIHTVAHRKDAFSKNRDTISKVFFYKWRKNRPGKCRIH